MNNLTEFTISLAPTAQPMTVPAAQYGHFAEHLGRCIYDGIWQGTDSPQETIEGFRADVLRALQALQIPVLRWPGGCFADVYHWRDGIGAPETRPVTVNTVWGWTLESNQFGTHEFFHLCELLGCAPYLAGNVGSGTVQELADWVAYVTADAPTTLTALRQANGQQTAWALPYLGIGNEVWGGGGQMTASYYANIYRQWQGYAKTYHKTPMWKIACGPNADDYDWTAALMQNVPVEQMQAISLHYYTVPSGVWAHKGDAQRFTQEEYYQTLRNAMYMDTLITKHSAIMAASDPEGKVALVVDEWGCWYDTPEGEEPSSLAQQNTMRDAMVAALTLHIFHRHTDRVKMANLAQMVNVLQALILTKGAQMLCTPTYHVFALLKGHQDGTLLAVSGTLPTEEALPLASVIATVRDGAGLLSVCHPQLSPQTVCVDCTQIALQPETLSAQILTGAYDACNTFDAPQTVAPTPFSDWQWKDGRLTLQLPPCSLVTVQWRV